MSAGKSAGHDAPRGRPKSYDPTRALARATEMFWARGYARTSMRDLVKATKVVPKSLYAEFGDKESLFVAAVEHYIEQQKPRYDRLGTEPFGLHRIREYYEGFRDAQDPRGCFLVNSLGEGALPRKATQRIRQFFCWLDDLYQRNLAAAALDGRLPSDADVRNLAAALLIFDQGLAIAARLPGPELVIADAALALLGCVAGPARRLTMSHS